MRARRRVGWGVVALASLGLLVGGVVGSIDPGLFDGRVSQGSAGRDLRNAPPTTVIPRLVDRQPPAGEESTLLPGRESSNPALIIPAIGMRATIVPEGIDRSPGDVGNLAIPEAANEVGWWDGGPAPGQGGVAVIAAHRVDDWAFWRLPEVQPGDRVQVVGTNGQVTNWSVTRTQQVLKADLPSSIWTEGGSPVLALVTCGGTFNYTIGHYNDNVIVWATPARQ